jgi:ubiquinone/menaquinone biosynthesis C-methylase UbiE
MLERLLKTRLVGSTLAVAKSAVYRFTGGLNRRERLMRRYVKGSGLEIGAFDAPHRHRPGVKVRYVDRSSVEQLKRLHSTLAHLKLIPIDVIDDVECLRTIPDESQDFVVANHVLEHSRNPLQALSAVFRVVKPGGVVCLSLPDRRKCFDRDRPPTPFAHLVRDYREGPAQGEWLHYQEYATLVDKARNDHDRDERARLLQSSGFDIHFHCWSPAEALVMLLRAQQVLGIEFELELAAQNVFRTVPEVVFVLRKPADNLGGRRLDGTFAEPE